MQIVPTTPVPAQSLSLVLNGQLCQINLYSLESPGDILAPPQSTSVELQGYPALYFDLASNGVSIVNCRLVQNLIRILEDAGYQGFEGDFVVVDTKNVGPQNGMTPVYTGLGSQFQLLYLSPTDLAAAA